MILTYLILFIIALLLSIFLTKRTIKIALKFKILDYPGGDRKIQTHPVPLLGGVAIFCSFLIVFILAWLFGWLDDNIISNSQLWGVVLGSCVLIVGGILDDKIKMKPWQSFLFPVIAALIAVGMGIAVKYITNPLLAGTGPYGRALFYFDWVDLKIVSFTVLFSFLWILGMTFTTKLLDGLDGLVSSVGLIGSLILFVVSLFWDVPMSSTSILCLILAGSLAGFLIFNWHPAKIFLGEGGSTFVGFMLGVLSIISGGKIATALLIMGIPILDVCWTILRRIFSGQHSYLADRKHLHFRLLDIGFSHRQAVLFLCLLTLIFGSSALFLQSQYKIMALGILLVIMVFLATIVVVLYRRKGIKQ